VQFHIIEKNGAPPMDHLAGRKDVVLLQPNDTVRFIARFEDFADDHTPYMYHCHNLYHEDGGMMLSFIVRDSVLSNEEDPQNPQIEGLVRVYPIPTQGSVFLQDYNPDPQRAVAMELWDIQGRKLEELPMDLGLTEQRIQLQQYVPGIYFLRVHFKDGRQMALRLLKH
jgi:bilirubin oxidase